MRIATDPEKRARLAALSLWGQFVVNIEAFPEEKFVKLCEALDRAGSSLDVLRKEAFIFYFFAFEFAILNNMQNGAADMNLLRGCFVSEALDFLSKNGARWGKAEDFLLRLHSYRTALSDYFERINASGGGGNIGVPVHQVFWPSVIGRDITGELRLSDAQAIKSVADQVEAAFLPLFQLALRELQVSGVVTHIP
jgi:hypothetical protein